MLLEQPWAVQPSSSGCVYKLYNFVQKSGIEKGTLFGKHTFYNNNNNQDTIKKIFFFHILPLMTQFL